MCEPVCLSVYSLCFGICVLVCVSVLVCVCLERGRPPRDAHQQPNTPSARLPSLNELNRSCEKGSSFSASISNKMDRYARFAIHYVFLSVLPNQSFAFYFQMTVNNGLCDAPSPTLKVQSAAGKICVCNILAKGEYRARK